MAQWLVISTQKAMNPSAKIFLSDFTFSIDSRLPQIVQPNLVVAWQETGHIPHRQGWSSP